jgi:hypothetical protein
MNEGRLAGWNSLIIAALSTKPLCCRFAPFCVWLKCVVHAPAEDRAIRPALQALRLLHETADFLRRGGSSSLATPESES